MAEAQTLTFRTLSRAVWDFMRSEPKKLLLFTFINFAFLFILILGLDGVGTWLFLLWILGYYLFHFIFFRWLFQRKPYFLTRKFFNTLLPAVKVMFMVLLGLTLLAYLPYFPLLFGGTSETLKHFITLFIGDFMGESYAYDFMISLVLLLLSPIIWYRPLLGWIASVIGRSGSFRNIFKHTDGYYSLFLKVMACFYVVLTALWGIDASLGLNGVLYSLSFAPLVIIFDLFIAKTYEWLFLD